MREMDREGTNREGACTVGTRRVCTRGKGKRKYTDKTNLQRKMVIYRGRRDHKEAFSRKRRRVSRCSPHQCTRRSYVAGEAVHSPFQLYGIRNSVLNE